MVIKGGQDGWQTTCPQLAAHQTTTCAAAILPRRLKAPLGRASRRFHGPGTSTSEAAGTVAD